MQKSMPLITLVLLFTLTASPAAGAGPAPEPETSGRLPEIRIGLSVHDVDGLWSGTRKESGLDLTAEVILKRPHLPFLGGDVFPNFGLSVNTGGDTSSLYAGLIWEYGSRPGIFVGFGLGAALHTGELETADTNKKQLGSSVLFRIPVELGYNLNRRQRLSIMFVHLSNAYLAHPNEGLDAIGVRYGYSF